MKTLRLSSCIVLCAAALAFSEPAPESSVVDLVADLEIADRRAEVSRLDLGDERMAAALGEGWWPPRTSADGRRLRWGGGTGSEIELFLSSARDLSLTLHCAPYKYPDAPVQSIEIEVNGSPVTTLSLSPGYRAYEVEIPASVLTTGTNVLRFVYGYATRPHDVGRGEDRRPLAVKWQAIEIEGVGAPVAMPTAHDQDLFLPPGSGLDYYISLPAAAELRLDGVTSQPRTLPITAELEIEGEAAREIEIPTGPATLGLGEGGRLARLSFRVPLWPASQSADELGLTTPGVLLLRPRITGREPSSTPAAAVSSREGEPRERPNVLLYVIDTLRADRLGAYGYDRPVSPHIDAFAEGAVLYENATAQSSWTRASIASIFTGLPPREHGANDRADSLAQEATTLAEILHSQGYRTAGFTGNGNVARTFEMHQGFDVYEQHKPSHQKASEIHAAAQGWLDVPDARPFFLFLHTVEPHLPYQPPAEMLEQLGVPAPAAEVGTRRWVHRLENGKMRATPTVLTQLRGLYDGEILANDRAFGTLVSDLEQKGLLANTLIVVVSDHGEEFHEHGGWLHGKTLYAESLQVPLIIRFPGQVRGRRVAAPAQHLDLLPTILATAGLPVPPTLAGRDLGQLGPLDAPSAVEIHSYLRLSGLEISSVIVDGWKLILPEGARARRGGQLFHLPSDPGETVNLADTEPIRAHYLENLIWRQARATGLTPGKAVIDPELEAELRALGYLE